MAIMICDKVYNKYQQRGLQSHLGLWVNPLLKKKQNWNQVPQICNCIGEKDMYLTFNLNSIKCATSAQWLTEEKKRHYLYEGMLITCVGL